MKQQSQPHTEELTNLLSALSVEAILGAAPSLTQITAQLADTSKRPAKAKKKKKKERHTFAPPTARPPRGPDLQQSVHEISFATRMRSDIADLHNTLRAAQAREAFLLNILGA